MNTKIRLVVAALVLMVAPATMLAADDHNHKHDRKHGHENKSGHNDDHDTKRQLDAHEHGVSTVKIAVDGNDVEVLLESPGADIVGFEHPAKSAEDKASIATALKKLGQAANVIQLDAGAGCEPEQSEAELHGDNADGGHTEFEAHYQFHCDKPGALTRVRFTFFTTFPSAREVDAQAVTAGGVVAAELTPGKPVLTLPR